MREGFDTRAATDDHLDPSLRKRIERRDLLEETHRVHRAQHDHRAG
jgi:hypothetical protein